MSKLTLFILLLIIGVLGESRNQSFSEPGISFQWNSNLDGWDIDQAEGPDNGVPELKGYLLVLGSNATDEFNKTYEPEWTNDNILRICVQYWKASEEVTERQQVRWVLNYTFPNELVNFTFQASNDSSQDQYVTDWCSRPHNYKTIIEFPPNTTVPLLPKDQKKADEAAAKAAGGRRLDSFSDHQDSLFNETRSRFLQATATTAADLAAEAAEDAEDAMRTGGGSKEKMFGILNKGTYHGINTTLQYVNQTGRVAKIHFERFFNLSDPELLDLKNGTEYNMILNWGIFKDENDASTEHIYGAESIKDVQKWILLEPRAAMWLKAPVLVTLLLLSFSYL